MKLTPAAAIFTTASFGFGCGTGRSTNSIISGPPNCFTWMAFIFRFRFLCAHTGFQIHERSGFQPRHDTRYHTGALAPGSYPRAPPDDTTVTNYRHHFGIYSDSK